ncbi:MAG: nucleotide-diphospho-sugar transferase [Methylococcaceae bacterium]|jgi:hypothetical protein
MSDWQLKTPVAFIIFNRPDTTAQVFAEIAKAKPPKLLVVADGPRLDRLGEAEKCLATRAIIGQINWPCEVQTNFADTNMGCKERVSSGLDWIFEQVPEVIILEDDCLPEPSFFRFCEELLAYYRDDERIAMISGDNFQMGKMRGESSYYLSNYNHIWGWASWRRAWRHYDKNVIAWPDLQASGWLDNKVSLSAELGHWQQAFDGVYSGQIDTWDYQWTFAIWAHDMLSIIPNSNLISNIGFGLEATHTKTVNEYANMATKPLVFPLQHPETIIACVDADRFTSKKMFGGSLLVQVVKRIKHLMGKLMG